MCVSVGGVGGGGNLWLQREETKFRNTSMGSVCLEP